MDFLIASSEALIVIGKVISFSLSGLLIILVMLQREKGGGLAGAFGGSGSIATFGVEAPNVAVKVTWWLFVIWMVANLSLAFLTKNLDDQELVPQEQAVEQQEPKQDKNLPDS